MLPLPFGSRALTTKTREVAADYANYADGRASLYTADSVNSAPIRVIRGYFPCLWVRLQTSKQVLQRELHHPCVAGSGDLAEGVAVDGIRGRQKRCRCCRARVSLSETVRHIECLDSKLHSLEFDPSNVNAGADRTLAFWLTYQRAALTPKAN